MPTAQGGHGPVRFEDPIMPTQSRGHATLVLTSIQFPVVARLTKRNFKKIGTVAFLVISSAAYSFPLLESSKMNVSNVEDSPRRHARKGINSNGIGNARHPDEH